MFDQMCALIQMLSTEKPIFKCYFSPLRRKKLESTHTVPSISKGWVTGLIPDLFHSQAELHLNTERETKRLKYFFFYSIFLYHLSTRRFTFFITVLSTEIQIRSC